MATSPCAELLSCRERISGLRTAIATGAGVARRRGGSKTRPYAYRQEEHLRATQIALAAHTRPSHDQASPKNLASEPDLRQINPAVVSGSIPIRSRKAKKQIKEAERRETDVSVLRAKRARQRAQSRSALASRRSTAVLARRLSPPDSAPGQASWDVAGAYDLMDRQPGRRSYAFPRALSAPACPSPGSTSRAGHSTGRHDARSRPGAAATNRRPQAPHSLHQPLSPGWRPST